MGESTNACATLRFDRRIRLEFRGATITSDAGLLACRELDDALGLTETAEECLQESRGGRNVQHRLVGLLSFKIINVLGRNAALGGALGEYSRYRHEAFRLGGRRGRRWARRGEIGTRSRGTRGRWSGHLPRPPAQWTFQGIAAGRRELTPHLERLLPHFRVAVAQLAGLGGR